MRVDENNLRSCTQHLKSILISTDLIMKGKPTQWFKKSNFDVREDVIVDLVFKANLNVQLCKMKPEECRHCTS